MLMHCVVVANASRARIFGAGELLEKFELVEELEHRDARGRAADLVSDDRGRTRGGGGSPQSGMEQRTDPHSREEEVFARKVSKALVGCVSKGHFERMIVIAPPGFLGVLRRIVPKTVQRKVVASVAKDFTNFSIHELPKRVRAVIPPTTGMPP